MAHIHTARIAKNSPHSDKQGEILSHGRLNLFSNKNSQETRKNTLENPLVGKSHERSQGMYCSCSKGSKGLNIKVCTERRALTAHVYFHRILKDFQSTKNS